MDTHNIKKQLRDAFKDDWKGLSPAKQDAIKATAGELDRLVEENTRILESLNDLQGQLNAVHTLTAAGWTTNTQSQQSDQQSAGQPVSNDLVKTGTGILEKLTIQPDGKIEFDVSGLKWPLKDARGAAVVATLFTPQALQRIGGHVALEKPAILMPSHFGQLHVNWEKPSKYYDVVRVYE